MLRRDFQKDYQVKCNRIRGSPPPCFPTTVSHPVGDVAASGPLQTLPCLPSAAGTRSVGARLARGLWDPALHLQGSREPQGAPCPRARRGPSPAALCLRLPRSPLALLPGFGVSGSACCRSAGRFCVIASDILPKIFGFGF